MENAPEDIKEQISKYNQQQIEDYFSDTIKFGTGGLRGENQYTSLGMNEYNIAKYAFAYGMFLLETYGNKAKEYGVVIAHDNRKYKYLYSEKTAKVLSALGIPCFLFENNELQPTPLVSYIIKNNDFIGGVNITASHNPPEYNGFKVYKSDGTQILPNDAKIIEEHSMSIENIFKIEEDDGLIGYLDSRLNNEYFESLFKEIPLSKEQCDVKVVFTPQHGTSLKIAKRIMDKMAIEYKIVEEQATEDEMFSNTKSANPKDPESFELARKYGDDFGADVLFGTDPDADRFGIEVRHNGEWVGIDGNELPIIQIYYQLEALSKNDLIKRNDFIVRSVVTSSYADKIASKYGVDTYETLTGFKWLTLEINRLQAMGHRSLFAWEESCGSLIRTFLMDKDSFQALIQVTEIVDYCKKQDMTMIDLLNKIKEEYGYYKSPQLSIEFKGTKAKEQMLNLVNAIRTYKNGDVIGDLKIIEVVDFNSGYKHFAIENMVMVRFEGDNKLFLRPSGTEPQLRIYYHSFGMDQAIVDSNCQKMIDMIQSKVNQIVK